MFEYFEVLKKKYDLNHRIIEIEGREFLFLHISILKTTLGCSLLVVLIAGAQPLRWPEGPHTQRDPAPLPLQFPNQIRSNSFSFKHQGYCFLRVLRNYTDRKFHGFYPVCYNFWIIYGGFSFFLTTQGKQIASRPILNAGPSEKFCFCGPSERKPQ